MKSTVDKLEGLTRKLNIEIPAEKVQSAFENAYKEIQKDASIKGFRKGKAPLSTIRTLYKEQVKQDVLKNLVSQSYQSALQEHALDPVDYPKVDVGEVDDNAALNFTAEVEVRPEIKVENYEGLEVEKEKLEITDKMVDDVLNEVRRSQAETVPVFEERGAQNDDIAVIDFEGFMNGQPLEGAKAEDHELHIGNNQFIPGFDEQIIGMKPGESKTIDLTFPEDHTNSEIAGQPVRFEVQLKSLKKQSLPEVNDEFAQKVGEYNNVEELKEAIRQDIRQREEKRINDALKNRIMKKLVEQNPVEVPEALRKQQKEALMDDVKKRMQQQGMDESQFEEYKKRWDADFDESAGFMVQSTFLVDTLADKLNLRATKDDMNNKMQEFAQQMGVPLDKVREFYQQQEQSSRLAFQVTEEKVLQYLIDKAHVKEVEKDQLSDSGE